MRPDVTFLVAAFDAADTIGRAVASALAQTGGVSVEVVVVDDCSADQTVAAAQALGDARVRVVRLPRNFGPGGARNAALAAATGRFVAILDADDLVHPGRMVRLVARLDATGADAVVDNVEVVEAPDRAPRLMFDADMLRSMPTLTLERFVRANRLFATDFTFGYMKPVCRLDVLREHAVRYPEDLRVGEDFLFLASLLAKGGRCVVEPEAGYAYHRRPGSISRVLTSAHVRNMVASDRVFLAGHALKGADRAAWKARTRSLEDAASFLHVIDAIKAGTLLAALQHAAAAPFAMRHLRLPIAARLRRWTARPGGRPVSPISEKVANR